MTERSLLIVCMNYAPEQTGCGKYTGEIGREMLSRGHDVAVVTTPPHYPGWRVAPGHSNGWSSEVSDGVRINRCPLVLREKMGGVSRLIAPASFALSATYESRPGSADRSMRQAFAILPPPSDGVTTVTLPAR